MKNLSSILIATLLIVSNVHAVVIWDGTSSTAWTEGAGTSASPYIISSPAHLKYLSTQVNAGTTYSGKYFKQTQDFNMNSKTWTSIGTSSNKFAGTYDGGNKYISNYMTPLFGYINNATIKNLKIQGTVSKSSNYAPLIMETAGTCNITNCHSTFSITETDACELSGMIYRANGTKLNMTRCSFSGKIADAGLLYHASVPVHMSECYCIKAADDYNPVYFTPFVYSLSNKDCTLARCYYINNCTKSHKLCGANNKTTYTACYVRQKEIVFSEGTFNSCYFIGSSSIPATVTAINCYAETKSSASACVMPRSAAQMKGEKIIEELNLFDEYFTMDREGINDGYPILKWQAGTRYTITATCDANRGTVTGGGEYANGNTAKLTATAKPGCTFVGWSDGNTSNPRNVTVSGNATYVAQFTKSNYIIYVNQDCTSNIE